MPEPKAESSFPLSRMATNPVGKFVSGAGSTALVMLAIRKALGTEASKRFFTRLGVKNTLGKGATNKQIATTAGLSGALAGIIAYPEREIYARGLVNKLKSGRGGFVGQEMSKLIRGSAPKKGTGGVGSLSEAYISPGTHALGRAAIGLLTGGPTGALTEGATGALGTALTRPIWARALAGRIRKGDKLTRSEKRLVNILQRKNQSR